MSLTFDCRCGHTLTVLDQYAGTRIRCPECREVMTAPTPVKPSALTSEAIGFADPAPRKVKKPKYVPPKYSAIAKCPQCGMPTDAIGEICNRCAGGRAGDAVRRAAARDAARQRKWEPERPFGDMFAASFKAGNNLLKVMVFGLIGIVLTAAVGAFVVFIYGR